MTAQFVAGYDNLLLPDEVPECDTSACNLSSVALELKMDDGGWSRSSVKIEL